MPSLPPPCLLLALILLAACSDGTGPGSYTPVPTAVAVVGGADQQGIAGEPLKEAVTVRVDDQRGRPMADVAVTWVVTAGGGTLEPLRRATDAQGLASAVWTLGPAVGENTVSVHVGGLDPMQVYATGTTGDVAAIRLRPDSVELIAGSALQFTVELEDGSGNPITRPLRWSSSDEEAVRVDETGLATVERARKAYVTVWSQGVSATAVVVVRPGFPSRLVADAGTETRVPAGAQADGPLAVRVTDAYGNGLYGQYIAWQVSGEGATVNPLFTVTDEEGRATTTLTAGRHAGAVTVTATASVVPGVSVPFSVEITPNATISGVVTVNEGSVPGTVLPFTGAAFSSASSGSSGSPGATIAAERANAGGRPTPDLDSPPSANRLVVTLRPGALGGRIGRLSALEAREVAREMRDLLTGTATANDYSIDGISPVIGAARLALRDPTDAARVSAALRARPEIAAVEPEVFYRTSRHGEALPLAAAGLVTPQDNLYPAQAWHYGLVDLPRAWRETTGSSSVVVAVLDTGVRFDHADLAPNLTNDGFDFVSQEDMPVCGVTRDNAGDGDGFDSDPTDPMDYSCLLGGPDRLGSHGTHVAGTIGAVGDNGFGVAGVNWNVKIRPVRVIGVANYGSNYDIAQGILYAAGLPADDGAGGVVQVSRADIINMSFGGFGASAVLEQAIQAAAAAGVLLVASAGNTSSTLPAYPASYPEVLSVAAVSAFGTPSSYSNYGPTVDISAPGGDFDGGESFGVLSTAWNFETGERTYAFYNGTSMAAAHVSGIAALLLAREPGLTAAELRARLLDFAVDAGPPGRDDRYGAGIVNARNSLTRTHAPARQLHVRLHDAATGAAIATVPAEDGAFRFERLPDGEYFLAAGYDEDGDGVPGLPGRIWGTANEGGALRVITVDGAGEYPVNFQIAYPMEREPNDTPALANPLPLGGYVAGERSRTGDVDLFAITVPGGTYTFETSGWQGSACGFAHAMDTTLELRRVDGSVIAANDDIRAETGYYEYCSRITTSLEAGTYYLAVSGTGGTRYRLEARAGQ